MGETARKVMQVSGYNNAGTVEFLLDKDKNFFFLEVNARLQVEHPVTELTTGTDLVHLQIKIAAGEKLPFKQEDLEQKGHAIECRIYAEDPHNGFLPSSGKILYFKEPQGPGVRHDCGIYSGWDVPIYYDPILAKLIVWAENRESACQRMIKALDDYVILGVQTSIRFLRDLIGHPQFCKGETITSFIQDHFADWTGEKDSEEMQTLALLAAAFDSMQEISSGRGSQTEKKEVYSPWLSLGKWRLGGKKSGI
jgi:acetyl-CoA carboxylase biotin carboxylase subunit